MTAERENQLFTMLETYFEGIEKQNLDLEYLKRWGALDILKLIKEAENEADN